MSQCDRESPNCKRCVKRGVACPGYPKSREAIFRDETAKTVRKANAGAFSDVPAVVDVRTNSRSLDAAKQRMVPSSMHHPLSLPDKVRSTCYFMRQLVLPVGWFPLIPKLYQASGPGGCLRWAVEAASMFLFANRIGRGDLLIQARTLYGLALDATNLAISDPLGSLSDETFCAILVLNVIDVSTNRN